MGENSTSSTYERACLTISTERLNASSREIRYWCFRWISDVEWKVWIRRFGASFRASQARSMSSFRARARLQITGPSTSAPILLMDSKSPGELMANPASMTSTPSRASCFARVIFSSTFMLAPGDCSPSRSVVSNMLMILLMLVSSPSCGRKSRMSGQNTCAPLDVAKFATNDIVILKEIKTACS